MEENLLFRYQSLQSYEMRNTIIDEDISAILQEIDDVSLNLSGKTILIAGGAGFLGSYLITTIDRLNKKVLPKQCTVISLDNYITGRKRNILKTVDRKWIHFKKADITKPHKISEKIDYIIHAAGLASPTYYQKYPIETIESAIYGAKNLLSLSVDKKVKGYLFFSSSEIYGDPDPAHIPTPETYRGNVSPTGPRSCYDESKRVGETLSMTYYRLYNTPVKIVRPFNVYGPGMLIDDYRVVPSFIARSLSGKPLFVHGQGKQTRTFCYISDAISGFFKVLLSEENGQTYNIGNDDEEITMMHLAKQIAKLSPRKTTIKTIPYPATYPQDEPRRRCPDLTKAKKDLSYNPQISLIEGLKRTMHWYANEYEL